MNKVNIQFVILYSIESTLFKVGAVQKCEDYRGIGQKSTCCAARCGTCGGSGCSRRPGGARNCCTSRIYQTCGVDGQTAPCIIVGKRWFA